MIWAYAVVDSERAPLPRVRGLGGSALEIVAVASAGVVVSRFEEGSPPEWSREALLEHEAVVEALMASRAVLPLRYGTVLRDDDALKRAMEERDQDWCALLERVRGRVEIAVTVPEGEGETSDADADSPRDGRRYLLEKVARHRAAVDLARRLDAAAAPLAEAVNTRVQPEQGVALKAAYLVRRVDAIEVRRQLERAGAGAICTGPWPPYSFTSAERLAAVPEVPA
jgi:Gas vesicle synthesis protein GvpL/GvpF